MQRPGEPGRMANLTRLIRQVCLLREQGDADGAARLQKVEVADAVREFRATHGPDALPESELQGVFGTEERRVAEAVILSELLLPRLVGSLPVTSRPAPPASQSAFGTSVRLPVPRPEGGAPAIPDLLDAMLAAERHGRRPAPAIPRES